MLQVLTKSVTTEIQTENSFKKGLIGWGYSSMVAHLPSMLQGPGFDPQQCKKQTKKKRREV
jgi:hypothetical protein